MRGRAGRAAAAVAGALMLAVAASRVPAPALALTGAAGLCVLASLSAPPGWREPAGTLAAAVAVVQCAAWPPGTAALAAEGLLILGYLILLDAPGRAELAAATRWLQGQARYGAAGLAAAAVVLAALEVRSAQSAWIALAGLAAAVAAYLVALPRHPR